MNQFRTLTLAVAAVALLWSGTGYAEKGKSDDKEKDGTKWAEKMEARREEFYKELGLNEEQKKALKENKDKHRKEKKELFESMHEKMKLMHEELGQENLDMTKINQIQDDLKAVQAKMIDQRLAHILEVRKILTPEQFKKFSEKMKDHKKRGGHQWGKKMKGTKDAKQEPKD
jgi:Spy/CpxP family protein refolding chaperone